MKHIRNSALAIVPTALFVVLWAVVSLCKGPTLVPPPWDAGAALIALFRASDLYIAFFATLGKSLLSFALAALCGVAIGALPGSAGPLRSGLDGLVDFLRSIPAPALLPLFMSILGLYTMPKLALAIFVCTVVNIVYTSYGIRQEENSLHADMARSFGASRWFLYRQVLLPGAAAHVLGGLRVTLSLALVISTLAELWLMTGEGVGVMIRVAYEDRDRPAMYALILVVGLLGLGLNRSFLAIERRITRNRYRLPELGNGIF